MIIENDLIRLILDPAQGAALCGLFDKATGLELSATAPCSTARSNVLALFCNRPFDATATKHDDSGSSATLCATSEDATIKLTKTFFLRKDERAFVLTVVVDNLTAQDRDVLWGETFVFGAPFIDPTSRIVAPIVSYFDPKEEPVLRMRWPNLASGLDISQTRCGPTDDPKTFFLTDFAQGKCGIVSPACKLSVELEWDTNVFQYCWLDEDFKTLSLSPHSGMPSALEEGHGTITLPAKGGVSTTFKLKIAAIV